MIQQKLLNSLFTILYIFIYCESFSIVQVFNKIQTNLTVVLKYTNDVSVVDTYCSAYFNQPCF